MLFFSSSKGYWIGNSHERTVVEAVSQTGIDVSVLSTADLRARLTYSAEDARALLDALALGDPKREENHRKVIDYIIDWLRGVRADYQREAFHNLI